MAEPDLAASKGKGPSAPSAVVVYYFSGTGNARRATGWLWFRLLAWTPVNALFEYSTLTRLYTRYREPDTDWSDWKS